MEQKLPIRPRKIKQDLADVFDRASSLYDHVGPQVFTTFGQRLVDLAQIPEGAQVLDVACGRGAILFPATHQVGPQGRVVGIDLSPHMVQEVANEILRQQVSNAEVSCMDAEHLAFADATFDLVSCGFALFFFPHLDRALDEYRRVLRPNGRLAVSTWGEEDARWSWFGTVLKATPIAWETIGWTQLPTLKRKDELHAVLTHAGFHYVQSMTEEQEFVYSSPEEWWAVQWSHGICDTRLHNIAVEAQAHSTRSSAS